MFAYLILGLNLLLLFLGDNIVRDKLGANYVFKKYSSGNLNWNHFNKADSIAGGYDANIETFVSIKINQVFNYTSATAVAVMELDKSHYVSQSNSLLRHELYHFKITEIVTQKLNKALDNNHFSSPDKTKQIAQEYLDAFNYVQNKYDTETNHSQNSDIQKKWEENIDKQLIEK